MSPIEACPLPATALLSRHLTEGAFCDCYATEVATVVTQPRYVAAFLTSPLFRVERVLLRVALGRPSTDDDARRLASGTVDRFAIWHVVARQADQLLLADRSKRTMTWLMSASSDAPDGATRLWFGSAVLPMPAAPGAAPRLGVAFHALLGFHRFYARALLRGARSRLATTA